MHYSFAPTEAKPYFCQRRTAELWERKGKIIPSLLTDAFLCVSAKLSGPAKSALASAVKLKLKVAETGQTLLFLFLKWLQFCDRVRCSPPGSQLPSDPSWSTPAISIPKSTDQRHLELLIHVTLWLHVICSELEQSECIVLCFC